VHSFGAENGDVELLNLRNSQVPSIPRDPAAILDRGIYVTVEWTEPGDNGGADITGYVIKYGDEYTDVDEYDDLSVDGNTTNFQFTRQLNELTSYQFAVAAVNAAGRGEFSEFTDYVRTWEGKHRCSYHVRYCELMRHSRACSKNETFR